MSAGIRVVRGPDWSHGNADNGEGHMGTIVKEHPDHTCDVIWDMGGQTCCRLGKDGKYDLRIIDNAPAGVTFKHIFCDGKCQSKRMVIGMRWKCKTCDDFDLCTQCYVTGEHNLLHPFIRFDTPNSSGVEVSMRGPSRKMKALGIFPGATVSRGSHWDFGDQDGGLGSSGKIIDIRSYGSTAGGRNAAKVKWENGESNVYRVGCNGKVDIKCVTESRGFEYYVDHLPLAGPGGKAGSSAARPRTAQAEKQFSTDIAPSIKVGDRVCVDIPPESLKELQRGRGGWSMRMNDCIGEPMKVKSFPSATTLEVEHEGNNWHFYIGACRKVHDISVNDVVQVLSDEKKVKLLQKNHGGWEDSMAKTLGKVGRAVKIDSDGDVAVAFGRQTWVYNAACLTPARGAKIHEMAEQDFTKSQTGSAREDLSDGLSRLMAHLLVLDALSNQLSVGPQEMIGACAKGDLRAVQSFAKSKNQLINCVFKDLTPLMVASNQGHMDIVKFLVENGANINATNSDNLTPLLLAISGKEETAADYLLSKGAHADVANNAGRSSAHVAAYEGLIQTLKRVLEKGCKPNRQDGDGDTPLHDAILKKNDAAVNMMLRHRNINLSIANKKGFTPILWAAFKGHTGAVQGILQRDNSVIQQTKGDGHTALHIASINNHLDIAKILLETGKADVDAQTSGKHTPLHLAAHEGYFEMTKLLLTHRANMAMKDKDGDTPLHIALMSRRANRDAETETLLSLFGLSERQDLDEDTERYKTAGIMVENGASLQVENNKGQKPLDVCRSQRVREAIQKFSMKVRPESTRRAMNPRSAGNQRSRPQTAASLAGLFTELLPMPCAVCEQKISDARLQPCGHRVTCQQCSMRCRKCPLCDQMVTSRTDQHGREIVEVPCKVQ